jgi:hypothetical protein
MATTPFLDVACSPSFSPLRGATGSLRRLLTVPLFHTPITHESPPFPFHINLVLIPLFIFLQASLSSETHGLSALSHAPFTPERPSNYHRNS